MDEDVANETALLNINNKISLTTERVEELWTELLQAWPAVKNNPEIAEKIEKLWDILKSSGNANHPAINKEIQNLIDSSSSILSSSTNQTSNTTTTSLNTSTQADDDLDRLLAEMLGENYQTELNHATTQIDNNQNISSFRSATSGKEELHKLVAPILGADWLNDDSETTNISSSHSNSNYKTDNNIDSLVSSIISGDIDEESGEALPPQYIARNIGHKQDIDELLNKVNNEDDLNVQLKNNEIHTEENIDELINEVLKNTSTDTDTISALYNDEHIVAGQNTKEDIDVLINEILNEETDFTGSINKNAVDEILSTNEKSKENIDELINEVLKNTSTDTDTISALSNDEHVVAGQNTKEDIDVLINEILNEETDFTGSINKNAVDEILSSNEKPKENIDELINEVLKNTSTDTDTISDVNIDKLIPAVHNEENTDELVNEILEEKADTPRIADEETNKDQTLITDNTLQKRNANYNLNKTETTDYKQPEKESSNTFIILLLILLILAATWWVYLNKDKIIQKLEPIKELTTKILPRNEEDTKVNIKAPEVKHTAPIIKEDISKTTPQAESYPDKNETNYTGRIENNDNDITIILNTPETAIDTKTDSNIFKDNEAVTTEEIKPLADDSPIENIPETSDAIETLSNNELVIEKAIKEKPIKKVTKRRVIIHKIVKGDTLWAIAKRYVNNPYRYRELAKLSKIKNPNRIYPGNKVKIVIYTK